MKETGAATVCSNQEHLYEDLRDLINNQKLQKEMYDRAIEASKKNHLVESTTSRFLSIIQAAIKNNQEKRENEC